MAHELSSTNGKKSIAYVGAKPWHGLGQELSPGAPIETWVQESGLSYELIAAIPEYQTAFGAKTFDDRRVLFRGDTGEALSVVSNKYKLVQPAEMVEFFRNLAEERGFQLETAGALFNGARYWALARTPMESELPGKDKLATYLMLASSCDNSIPTMAKYVATRVVCNNTITLALREKNVAVKVSHRTKFSAADVQQELGLAEQAHQEFVDQAKVLSKRKVSKEEALQYLICVLGDATKPVEKQTEVKSIAECHKLFSGDGIGMDKSSAKGTAYGLVQSVTEYVDHRRGSSQDRRLFNAWFCGVGEGLKQQAFKQAVEMFAA